MRSIQKIEVHEKKPVGFKARIEVSACYLEIEDKILLLKEGFTKQEVGAWGVPAGKIEKQETPEEAARRELFEETGIRIENSSQIQGLGCIYVRKLAFDYVYHLFQIILEEAPSIYISQEHQSYGWFPTQHLHNLPLMTGAKESLEYYLKRVSKANEQVQTKLHDSCYSSMGFWPSRLMEFDPTKQ